MAQDAEEKAGAGEAPEPETVAPGRLARDLIRAADRATLATSLARDGALWPYASLVMVASAADATPLLLISDLAEHTKNILRDVHVSLLFDGTGGREEPLTGPRLTLVGRARATDDPADRARFLARHPSAAPYSSFHDFRYFRIEATRGHLVAGFGRIHWIDAAEILYDDASASALAASESDIIAHMNKDHGAALTLYAQRLLGLSGEGWTMTGIDPEGIDMRRRGRLARLSFERPVASAEDARAALVRLVGVARAKP